MQEAVSGKERERRGGTPAWGESPALGAQGGAGWRRPPRRGGEGRGRGRRAAGRGDAGPGEPGRRAGSGEEEVGSRAPPSAPRTAPGTEAPASDHAARTPTRAAPTRPGPRGAPSPPGGRRGGGRSAARATWARPGPAPPPRCCWKRSWRATEIGPGPPQPPLSAPYAGLGVRALTCPAASSLGRRSQRGKTAAAAEVKGGTAGRRGLHTQGTEGRGLERPERRNPRWAEGLELHAMFWEA